MPFEDMITDIASRLMRRLIRRGIAAAVFALFVLIAIYHLTIAGIVALEALYGPLYARLIAVGAYVVLAAIALTYLFATRAKKPSPKTRSNKSGTPTDVRIALLLESILLGYTAGRGKSRHS
jgi:hypothetical protein